MKKHVLHFFTAFIISLITLSSNSLATSFVDDSGNLIKFQKPYKRIISLYPAHTENIISIGGENLLIGVSPHETFPPLALTKPIFSYHDDVEKFLQARPDLILIRPMIYRGYKKLMNRLKEAGIEVVSLQPTTVEGMFDYWLKLGKLIGREAAARQNIERFKERIREIESIVGQVPKRHRKRVYFEAIHKRMKTFSPNSIAIFVLKTAGGINVACEANPVRHSNIAEYGKEKILSHAAETDVYLAQKGAMNRISVEMINKEPGFQAIRAVREGKVFIIDESIVSRPTMRVLEGIYEIARFLYPKYFNSIDKLIKKPKLTRADYSEMFIKFFNLPLVTPTYQTIKSAMKQASKHWYGEFVDVDYSNFSYKYIETAVSLGLFELSDPRRFYPNKLLTRKELAYSLYSYGKSSSSIYAKVSISDVKKYEPYYAAIMYVLNSDVLDTDSKGNFYPDATVSGKSAMNTLKKFGKVSRKQLNEKQWSFYRE